VNILKGKRPKRPAWLPKGVSELEYELTERLSRHCGERGLSEGAVETLDRIIRERDLAVTKLALLCLKEKFHWVL
jgi:hypothetical protein